MIEPGTSLENNCAASDAYCNGSKATADNGMSSDKQHLPAAKLGDVLSGTSRSDAGDDCYVELVAQRDSAMLEQNEQLRSTNQQMSQEFREKIEVIF